MKSIRFNCLWRALLLAPLLLDFSATAQPLVFSNAAPRAIPRRASIILVVADGLGYGDLSCYGQTNFETPNLDKLAAEGVRFTNYFAGAAADSPACAALMLGKDSGHLRQRADADIPLAPDEITVAQVLQQAGYHTGLIGEWNLGDENSSGAPWKKGFDEFAGYFDPNDAENVYADYVWRYAPKSIFNETNKQMDTFIGRETLVPNLGGAKGEYLPDVLTRAALNFIKNNQPDKFNRYRPFFLLLNYKIPGDGKSQVPTDAPFSEEKWPQPAKNKAAMIARLDGYIAQLTATTAAARHDQQRGGLFHQRNGSAKDRRGKSKLFPQHHFHQRPARADDCSLAGPDSRRNGQRFQMVGAGFPADGGGNWLRQTAGRN